MGFKDSKSVRILKEYGIKPFMSHCLHKSIKSLNRRSIFVLLQFYPKIVLDKSQFKTFKLAYQHFEENYRNIIAISPSFFIKNLKKHIAWLESDIFKNQYGDVENLENISKNTIGATSFSIQKDSKINTFTPPPPLCQTQCNEESSGLESNASSTPTYKDSYQFYPPLLQPESIDYSTIDSKIALELRLPPAVPYKFVFVRYSLSGSFALQRFFERCNVYPCEYIDFLKSKSAIHKNTYFDIQHFHTYEAMQDNKKLYCLKPQDTIILLARDPISRLKTLVNHGWYVKHIHNLDHSFTMQEDPYDVVNRKGYHNEHYKFTSNSPFVTNGLLSFFFSTWSFDYSSVVSKLALCQNITYIDMQEIMPERAFDTMTKLAKKFNFTLPNEKDREFYRAIRFDKTSYILPLACIIPINHTQKITLHITSLYEKNSDFLSANNTIFDTPHPLLDQVAFGMSEDDLKALQDDKETLGKVKAYMVRFLDELKKAYRLYTKKQQA